MSIIIIDHSKSAEKSHGFFLERLWTAASFPISMFHLFPRWVKLLGPPATPQATQATGPQKVVGREGVFQHAHLVQATPKGPDLGISWCFLMFSDYRHGITRYNWPWNDDFVHFWFHNPKFGANWWIHCWMYETRNIQVIDVLKWDCGILQ